MLILLILLIILSIILFKRYRDDDMALFSLVGAICLWIVIVIIPICSTTIGMSVKTGYIYNVSTAFGRTKAYIRLGENAGEDVQEPICTENEEFSKKLYELNGSGIKVRIKEKGDGIILNYKLFYCTSHIEEIEEVNN